MEKSAATAEAGRRWTTKIPATVCQGVREWRAGPSGGEMNDEPMAYTKVEIDAIERAIVPLRARLAAAEIAALESAADAEAWRHSLEVVVLPMAKGYAREHPVGRNVEMLMDVEDSLSAARPGTAILDGLRAELEQAKRERDEARAERDQKQKMYAAECAGSWSRISKLTASEAERERLREALAEAQLVLIFGDLDGGESPEEAGRVQAARLDLSQKISAALASSGPSPEREKLLELLRTVRKREAAGLEPKADERKP